MDAHLAFVAIGIAFVFAAVGLAPVLDEVLATWLIFLGLLPLVNALFDWLSIGVTRTLLRWGETSPRRAMLWGLADLGIALVLFVALRALILVLVYLLNIVDLPAVFADLRDPEGARSYWWLYATIFTTLVPTLLHASVVVFSLPALIPPGLRQGTRWCLARAKESHFAKTGAVAGLTLVTVWALVLPPLLLVGLWYGLVAAFPTLGGVYLNGFQYLACQLDASVSCPVF